MNNYSIGQEVKVLLYGVVTKTQGTLVRVLTNSDMEIVVPYQSVSELNDTFTEGA